MQLSTSDVKTILQTNPQKKLVEYGQKKNKELRLHMYGDNLETTLTKIKSFENDLLIEVRRKYAKSNRDLMERLARPIDKVFSARGGSVYYNMSEALDKKASAAAANVRDGYSIKTWIETYWKQHWLDDPCGMMFLEVDAKGRVYPTYKSISTVFDYLPKGAELDYIVFELSSNDKKAAGIDTDRKVYRVIDDLLDTYYELKGTDVSEIKSERFTNFFGKVPALLNSDFVDPTCEGSVNSLFASVIKLADDFLLTGSVRNLSKVRHGFPKYWEYGDACKECEGTGYKGAKDCEACSSTGRSAMIHAGDLKILETPGSKNDVVIAPNVAGFIAFPKDYFEISSTELQQLENLMTFTIWGKGSEIKTTGPTGTPETNVQTATQAVIEIKPEEARLMPISKSAEKRHKFFVDNQVKVQLLQSNYAGASVNYGRRYMLENADTIWKKYSDARAAGSAINLLDELLIEYYDVKYSGDDVGLQIAIKAMRVEPFVHFKVIEIQALGATAEDYAAKLYFGEWYQTVTDATLLTTPLEGLKKLLYDYVADKAKAMQAEAAKKEQKIVA